MRVISSIQAVARRCDAHRSSRGGGFTLIELLVTVSLASVLLAIAVPSFTQMVVGSRLTAQANEVVAALAYARSEAIKRNTTMTFCRASSAAAASCATSVANWEHWMVRSNSGLVVRRGIVKTYSGGIVVQSTLTNDQLAFGPDGLARTGGSATTVRVNVCSTRSIDNRARHVVVGAGSRVNTLSDNVGCG